ncbi:carboxymuconolactone decarboxylase family protein [Streptomyces sp. CB02460]|uniref:carboxymuconolactone decarboxylase family protein n=1 Tax=Streptomyces sp. CB02460 TaxID=1703941 RepID=UPI0009392B4C|nr:carboxymuconolactone decarboxylase family protein [Streptomyces sp. CB02460]OKJ67338.1 hypothetical protein AMK30_30880 [Streptomyces sp. CB02460]
MRQIVGAMLRHACTQIRYVTAVRQSEARGDIAAVYAQAVEDFGVLAPPLALHSPSPAALAAAWTMLREGLLVDGATDRAARERVAAAVSRANACPYCVDVHRATYETLDGAADEDPELTAWARAAADPGAGTPPWPASWPPDRRAEFLAVAVVFHYLNRMVTLFLAESPMPAAVPGPVRGPMMRTVARAMRPAGAASPAPGRSLPLLPAAPAPEGFSWAEDAPAAADAFGRAAAATDAAVHWLPEPVRALVNGRLDTGDHPRGPSRAWFSDAVAGLPAADRPAAALALLVAYAPYQVTDQDVAAFRARHPGDRALVELTSWAALRSALSTGRRLGRNQEARTAPRADGGGRT